MAKLKEELWTAVQHSGAGYGGDYSFSRGLEERIVSTDGERNKIIKARGVMFKTYNEASDFCMEEQYPPGHKGMIPKAPGSFMKAKIDDLHIYSPRDRPAGAVEAN